jgi:hypothetical protein
VNDLAIGVIVATLAAVPLSLLVLALADVIRMPDIERRHRWINRCLVALALPVTMLLGLLVWGWAGATHLGPLCAAYGSPEFRNEAPLALRSVAIDSDQGAAPAWSPALLKSAGGPLDFLEHEPAPAGSTLRSAYTLQARRITHHQNRWFKVEMDRFQLLERSTGGVVAEGDEIWIQAGRAQYHCGIGSGRRPTTDVDWPAGTGVARFVAQAALGASGRRTLR